MGVPLSRAWEICAVLDEQDAARAAGDLARAAGLSAQRNPAAPAAPKEVPRAKAKAPPAPRPRPAKPERPVPAPRRTPPPRAPGRGIDPDAAERLRRRRRDALGLG